MKNNIYFDYNATTPVDKRIVDAIVPLYTEQFGNPSNMNSAYGKEADRAYKSALRTIADYFMAESIDDIIITSGATESNNLILQSMLMDANKTCRIITSRIEHDSIIKTLESFGDSVIIDYVKNDETGVVDLADLESKICENTVLITIMGANNEIGTVQPIDEIAEIAHRYDIPFHSDATQLVPHERIDLAKEKIDYISISGHKIYAPKGVGLLVCRNDDALTRIKPQIVGGGQQNGYRSGTINVPGVVSIAKAIELLDKEIECDSEHNRMLFDTFFEIMNNRKVPYHLNGAPINRIHGNISVAVDGISSVKLLSMLSGYSISTGSACSTGKKSHVLKAINCSDDVISGTIRVGFGRFSQKKDIASLAERIADIYDANK